jgi:hypothetical protein
MVLNKDGFGYLYLVVVVAHSGIKDFEIAAATTTTRIGGRILDDFGRGIDTSVQT